MVENSGGSGRIRKYRKRLVVSCLLLFIIIFQGNSDEYSGQIILERTSFRVDEEFILSILIPEIPPLILKIEEPELPAGVNIIKGPYIRPGRIGSVADYYFKVEKEGRFIIGSFVLGGQDPIRYTVPVFITAGDSFQPFKNFDKIPPSIRWELDDKEYYPGQVVPLQFTVENMEISDIIIESTVLKKPEGIVRRISRNSEKFEKHVTPKTIMTGEIYDIDFHNHIFVPLSYGEVTLPDIQIYLSKEDASYSTVLKGIPVNVKKVSGPAGETGAVGNFQYSFEASAANISSSSYIILNQKVWGTGNFYGLEIPGPYTDRPDYIELTVTRDRIEALPAGKSFTGYRDISYRLNLKCDSEGNDCSGKINLNIPDFKWMVENTNDIPEQYKYQTARGGAVEIEIVPDGRIDRGFQFMLQDEAATGIDSTGILGIITALILAGMIPVVFFLGKNRIKKSVIIFISILLIISALFFLKKGLAGSPDYGVVYSGTETVSILSIPDDSGTIIAEIASGQRIRIKNSVDAYYLISVSESEDGWILKENVRIEE